MALLDPAFTAGRSGWNEKTARHLLNRAGFGIPVESAARLAAMEPAAAVAAFVDYEKLPDVGPVPPADLPERIGLREMRMQVGTMTEEERRKFRQERQREAREAMLNLEAWWLERMCKSQRPLQEKMTLFWHGHFATSAEKVKDPRPNLELNEVFRQNATGNIRELTRAVGKSPCMMRYLDQQQSSRRKPNENWARELLELFTLGISNYTETDIKEAARAFTGWTDLDGKFVFDERRHDPGRKSFLGRSGTFNGDEIIDIVFQQPACSRFFCRKLWKFFAYDEPEAEVVEGLARTLEASNLELKPVLRQMFLSQAFYQPKAINTQIKSPAQLCVNLMVQLDADLSPRPPIAQLAMRAMGQALFYPPNVKGWDGGRAWINTNTLLVRYNMSNYLVSGVVPNFGAGMRGGAQNKNRLLNRRQMLSGTMASTAEDSMFSGDGEMMMQAESRQESMAPAGQDAMPREVPSTALYRTLQQRRAERMQSQSMARAPFKAREFFSRYEGKSAEQIVDTLAQYFIGFPLAEAQRQKLISALAQGVQPGQPVPVGRMAEEDLRATVQLLLSTVEYQVC